MNCQIIQNQLSEYLDGELTLEDRERVEAHLETCSECAREYQQLRQLTGALRQIRHDAPVGMWNQVQERIEAQEPTGWRFNLREWFSPMWRPLGAAAILVLGFVAYFWFTQPVEEIPLDYYLDAHAEFAAATPFSSESMVALVTPRNTDSVETSWDDETELLVEWYLNDN